MAELIWDNTAECGMLSCLIHSSNLIDYISTLVDDDTFHGFNQYLYLLLVRLNDEGKLTNGHNQNDLILRMEASDDRGFLPDEELLFKELCDFVPTPAHYQYYLLILQDKRVRNAIVENCNNFIKECFKKKAKPSEILEDFTMLVKEAKGFLNKKDEIRKVGEISESIKEEIDVRTDEVVFKIKTGFKNIDKIIRSLEGGDMFVIAARPSIGKTSLLIDILIYVAFVQKVRCGFFSLEMPVKAIIFRIIQSLSWTNIQDHFNGATRESWKKISAALKIMQENNNIDIDDTAGLDIAEFRRKAKVMKEKGVGLIGIDYIQLMTAEVKNKQNREQELSYISSEIKGVAKDLNIPIIVLAQLNRKPEQRKGKKPLISDLRESGSIEQDADMVGLLSREEDKELKVVNCMLDFGKNRNGEPGKAHIAFVKHLSKFINPTYGPTES